MRDGADLGCSCIIDDYGCEATASPFACQVIQARKRWKCCECGERIEVGEEHEFVRGCWEGYWATYRTCAICLRIRNAYFCTWVYGSMRERLWEELGVDYITGETREDADA